MTACTYQGICGLLLGAAMAAVAKSGSFAVLTDHLSRTLTFCYLAQAKEITGVSPPEGELLCDAQALCDSADDVGFSS